MQAIQEKGQQLLAVLLGIPLQACFSVKEAVVIGMSSTSALWRVTCNACATPVHAQHHAVSIAALLCGHEVRLHDGMGIEAAQVF